MSGSPPARRNLAILFLLTFAQGLPFGFQKSCRFFAPGGLSLTKIGLARIGGTVVVQSAVGTACRPLRPRPTLAAESRGSCRSSFARLGVCRRRVRAAARQLADPDCAGVLMNILTATQDIAVDGLAIDLFKGQQVGGANVAQVVGYKIGMLVGGGVLLRASASIGWRGMLFALAALVVVVLLAV